MAAERLLTIGVYGFSEEAFFRTLVDAGVDLFCDVRARRGLRGSEYVFANAKRLERRLAELGIAYAHLKNLAPSAAVREAQHHEDDRTGVGKRARTDLSAEFIARYRDECLSGMDAAELLRTNVGRAKRPVFFCVERSPTACHRSLLTGEIARQTGLAVEHLEP